MTRTERMEQVLLQLYIELDLARLMAKSEKDIVAHDSIQRKMLKIEWALKEKQDETVN